jgi:hypothetical protein
MSKYLILMVMLIWLVVGKCIFYGLEKDHGAGVLASFAFPLIATIVTLACMEKMTYRRSQ